MTLRFSTSVAVLWFVFATAETAGVVEVPWTSDVYAMVIAVSACFARCTEMVVNHGMKWRQAWAEMLLACLAGFLAHTIAVELMSLTAPRVIWSMCATAGFAGSYFLAYAIEKFWPGMKTP